ncbi:MAG: tetratricopeptide repeat protein [Caldilineaceae bacterium]|nr:tetratricopeptide repeat protein [Caldilineaceae bacterium]
MPNQLQFTLLGRVEIRYDDQILLFETSKSQALLIYLALNRGWWARDLLAELLWPDMANAQARKNLRDGLLQARAAVGDWVIADAQRIRFAHERVYAIDVLQFTEAVAQGRREADWHQVQAALQLYQGDFLQGFHVRKAAPFEEWVTQKREELYTQQIDALEWLAEQQLLQHDYHAGLNTNRRLIKLEPWRESGHRRHMQLLALHGRIGEALAHYSLCQRLLLEELGIEPSAETTTLYEQIRSGAFLPLNERNSQEPAATPPTAPAMATETSGGAASVEVVAPPQPPVGVTTPFAHNLPRQLTPLIGRQEEIAAIRAKLLDPYYPLVTLSGEGGIGKTRLAIAVAETLHNQFNDGVWFISLADMTPSANLSEQLAVAIGKALRCTFAGPDTLVNQLLTQLRPKQLLLIFDNFEHVLAGADLVLTLLQTVHGAKVLATSRHRLGFLAEYVVPLSGLPMPDATMIEQLRKGLVRWEDVLAYPSVALFIERANRFYTPLDLTLDDRIAVLQIIQLVVGLPLGLELAAAQLRQLSCTQVAARLRHNCAVLATTLPDLPPRQRSMQATITYSWQLLTSQEAAVLAQCAVFNGGFTAPAAQAVADAKPEILISLQDHSLLSQTLEGRFELHEFVRQYALEQLETDREKANAVRDRHCAYFAIFLAWLEQSQNRDQAAQLTIRADLKNVRTAWLWSVAQGKVFEMNRSLKSLARFYYLAGFLSEATSMLHPAIASVRALIAKQEQPRADQQRLLARLLLETAFFDAILEQRATAEAAIAEAIGLAQALADPSLEALGHVRLGDLAWSRADYPQHRAAYTHSLALTRQHALLSLEAHCLSNLGMSYDEDGRYADAIAHYEAALAIARALGNRQQESIVYYNLSVSHKMLGSFGQTVYYYQQALQLAQALSDQEGIGFAYFNQGSTLSMLGELTQAEATLEQALTLFRQMKVARLEAKTLLEFGRLYEQMGDYKRALTYGEQALVLAETGHYQATRAETLLFIGHLRLTERAFAPAVKAFEQAGQLWETIGQPGGQLSARAGWVQAQLQQGHLPAAQAEVEQILAVLDDIRFSTGQRPDRIFWICYQVLTATNDQRAASLFQRGYELIQAQAATLSSPTLRQSFLYNVPAHRDFLAIQR